MDISTKAILACDSVDSGRADVKRFAYLADCIVKGGFSVRRVVADKGYDAEYVHTDVRERMNTEAFIPVGTIGHARTEGSRVRTSGFNRGMMKFFFNREV